MINGFVFFWYKLCPLSRDGELRNSEKSFRNLSVILYFIHNKFHFSLHYCISLSWYSSCQILSYNMAAQKTDFINIENQSHECNYNFYVYILWHTRVCKAIGIFPRHALMCARDSYPTTLRMAHKSTPGFPPQRKWLMTFTLIPSNNTSFSLNH